MTPNERAEWVRTVEARRKARADLAMRRACERTGRAYQPQSELPWVMGQPLDQLHDEDPAFVEALMRALEADDDL